MWDTLCAMIRRVGVIGLRRPRLHEWQGSKGSFPSRQVASIVARACTRERARVRVCVCVCLCACV
jgi:hypothetical protein